MKVKRILRFYYCADSLERAFDNLILKIASSYDGSGFDCADRLCRIIDEKSELAALWDYLDGVISRLPEDDGAALEEYARLRCGIKRLNSEQIKRLRLAVIKFKRRARRLEWFKRGVELAGKYYCLTSV